MRAIVTGGAGFIGSHVVDALVARGDEVHALDDLSTGKRENVGAGAVLHEADELEGGERRREYRGTTPGIRDLDRLEDLVHGRNLFASR